MVSLSRAVATCIARLAFAALGILAPLTLPAQAPASEQQGAVRPENAATTPRAADAVRLMRATRLPSAVRLDGKLDESAWEAAEVASDFTQSWPDPGAPASQKTEVRVLYDADALYVGVRMFDDAPATIAAPLARRDASGIYSDWVHLVVDTYRDRRNAFRFTTNPRGVQKDVLHLDDRGEDLNWDAVWEVVTSIDSLGWVAEYRIPFSQLRFEGSAAEERIWGIQVQRDVARNNERTSWSPWKQQDPGYVSRFGDVVGLREIHAPRRLELLPYVSARATRAPGREENPFWSATETSPSVGADLKVGLPKGLTLAATINPDFGQVEVDPAVVNLSAFETFFSEKRPFFVEGAGTFNFGRARVNASYGGQEFFYSRRIGRRPQRGLPGAYADIPDATTISAAAKVTGKTGAWTVGIMDAVTDEEEGRFVRRDPLTGAIGPDSTAIVEPRSNYFVGRVRRDLRGGNTVVGGMLSTAHRDLSDPVLAGLLRSRAVVGGLDFEHLWADRKWALTGYTAASAVAGRAAAITAAQHSSSRYYGRPDADYLSVDPTQTSLEGRMTELAIQKTGAFGMSAGFKEVTPGFELNDVGFQGRVDYRSAAATYQYNSFKAGDVFRSWGTWGGTNHAFNFGGDRIWHSYWAGGNVQLNNFWFANLNVGVDPETYADRLTWGGAVGRRPTGGFAGLYLGSDSRKPVVVGGFMGTGGDAAGGRYRDFSLDVTWRPTSSLRINVGPNYGFNRDRAMYVTTVADPAATATYEERYVFADLEQTTIAASTRVEWTFTPDLSLQLFAQPFISVGTYAAFKELSAPRTRDYAVYGEDRGTITPNRDDDGELVGYTIDPDGTTSAAARVFDIGNPDFNFRSLRGNAVLRWEYRPGSALFVVWQQQRADAGPLDGFDFRRDSQGLFRARPTNVLLIKATYWLAP